MSLLAVVVPTIRPQSMEQFRRSWEHHLVGQNDRFLVQVDDGDVPTATVDGHSFTAKDFEAEDLIFNCTDACRNLGFLVAAKLGAKTIVTLDDDVSPPFGTDPIFDHQRVLGTSVPTSWFSIASEYMRGFPYGVRSESEVWVSHGVWVGVHDYDGPTQLVNGNKPATFYKGPIPKGPLMAMCGMNLAFKIETLPWLYFAPMGTRLGVNRFGDIWAGIRLKRKLDELHKAIVSGYSTVHHERASDVLKNLEDEARGIRINEVWWRDPDAFKTDAAFGSSDTEYFSLYDSCYHRWQDLVAKIVA